ncbi:MAG TPA: restriction endonuclease [Trebonia sp.]|jgi:restriction system protein|nr:restriction endonuclease [Trebonia sp.]
MSSFWAAGGQVVEMMAELIGTKLGLAVTSDDLAKAVREWGLSDLWPDDYEGLYRYRAEMWERLFLELLDAFGDPEAGHVRRSPLITSLVISEFGDEPEVWEVFDKTLLGLKHLRPTAGENTLDPRPLIDGIAAEYGSRGGLLAARLLQEVNARVSTSPWTSVSRQDFDSAIPLRHLFASEELPIALGMFFDQRFIDFLHANLVEVATMHWRQFEGLVAERLRRSGLHVVLGPGRNDEGVDIRAWDAEPGADDPALLLV